MAEHVEVVIKIPKYYLTHPQDYTCLAECVRRGTILPEHHGRLIDADALYDSVPLCHTEEDGTACVEWREINDAPTIIEGGDSK